MIVMQIAIDVDPYLLPGQDWLVGARNIMLDFASKSGLKVGMTNGAGYMYDTVNEVFDVAEFGQKIIIKFPSLWQVYDDFPVAIGVTVGVVFVFVGLAFRSVVVPIRAIFTITLTLSFVYGAADFVYAENILNGMGFWGLLKLFTMTGISNRINSQACMVLELFAGFRLFFAFPFDWKIPS